MSSKVAGTGKSITPPTFLYYPAVNLSHSRYCKYGGKNPEQSIRAVTLRLLYSFFGWVLDQRRGKSGRRVCGIKSSSTLGTYWKIFRLIYEEANDSKIHGKLNRKMHRVSTLSLVLLISPG
jgi:hypothetical protein